MSITWSGGLMATLHEMQRQVSNTQPLMQALAKEMDVAFREHFRQRDSQGNKMGWPSRHFWTREVMRFQTFEASERRASLSIASPAFLHKITGGTIQPKKGKSLAIPQHPMAYSLGGPKASGLNLAFVPVNRGKLIGYLMLNGQRKFKGKMVRGSIMYALVRSVTQAADPDALPNQQDLEARISRNIQAFLATLSRL